MEVEFQMYFYVDIVTTMSLAYEGFHSYLHKLGLHFVVFEHIEFMDYYGHFLCFEVSSSLIENIIQLVLEVLITPIWLITLNYF